MNTYSTGFAPRDYSPRYPSLWDQCRYCLCPSLGATGGRVLDWSGRRRHAVLTSMDPATDWLHDGLDLDAVNDYLQLIPSGDDILPGVAKEFAISWWEKLTITTGFPSRFFMTIPGHSTRGFWAMRTAGTSYGPLVWVGTESGVTSLRATDAPTVAGSLNIWRHWVLQGTDLESLTFADWECWVDGVSHTIGNGGNVGSISGNTKNRFGVDGQGDSGAGCVLDDLRIYHRKLKPSEIGLLKSRPRIAYEPAIRTMGFVATGGGGVFDRHQSTFARRSKLLVPSSQ